MAVRKRSSEYNDSSIRVLKGLEPVRQRPGMYTLTDNPLHIIQEVLDNASDEILAGYGTKITLTRHTDGSITVEDDGRGTEEILAFCFKEYLTQLHPQPLPFFCSPYNCPG